MAKLSPLFNSQTVTDDGVPASGWKINTYVAGSSTPQATYTAEDGLTAQANPIQLDADGFPPNPIWLTNGEQYKFVLTDENDVPQRTFDNVSGVNDTTTSVSQWQASGLTPTYIGASSFSLAGDQTSEFHVGRKLQFTVTAGTVYGTIATAAYTSLTTVTVTMDSGNALDSGLSAVNLSLLRADHPALPKSAAVLDSIGAVNKAGDTMTGALNAAATATVASATTCDIGAAASNSVIISGTTTITGLGTIAAGAVRDVTFSDILTLTHNGTSLILPTGANITTAAGDTASFVSLGSGNWRCLFYQTASGRTLIGLTLGTPVTTSGSLFYDITSIPSWVKRITLMFNGVSGNGTSPFLIQLGDAGGIEPSGYTGGYAWSINSASGSALNSSAGFPIFNGGADYNLWGSVTLTRFNDSNTWVCSGSVMNGNSASGGVVAGVKQLSATLDRIRITHTNGTDTFDGGSINILYE